MPFSESRSRRIRSSDSPSAPHGTKCSSPRSSPAASRHSTTTAWPSARSPKRPSAIEKPALDRAVAPLVGVRPHASPGSRRRGRRPGGRSRRSPARSHRDTACRTPRMLRPSSENSATCRIASSPSSRASIPARWNASAPRSLAASTAGTQPNDRASSSHARDRAGPGLGVAERVARGQRDGADHAVGDRRLAGTARRSPTGRRAARSRTASRWRPTGRAWSRSRGPRSAVEAVRAAGRRERDQERHQQHRRARAPPARWRRGRRRAGRRTRPDR